MPNAFSPINFSNIPISVSFLSIYSIFIYPKHVAYFRIPKLLYEHA